MKSDWFEPSEADSLVFEQELLHLEMVEELCRAMEEQSVTRTELARRCGITLSALSQRLSGRKYMTTGTLAQMAHALGQRFRAQLVDEETPLVPTPPPVSAVPWSAVRPTSSTQVVTAVWRGAND